MSEKYPKHEQLIDIASAFNFERKGLKTILEYAMSGTPVKVVVTSQDRLARSGFQLIRWIIELYGGEIIILDKKIKTEKFDTTYTDNEVVIAGDKFANRTLLPFETKR